MEVVDLTSRLTTQENRALVLDLPPHPLLQPNFCLFMLYNMATQQTELSILLLLETLSSN
jgi:hypothetical protein